MSVPSQNAMDTINFSRGEFKNRYSELRFRQSGLERDLYPMKIGVLVVAVAALAFIYKCDLVCLFG